MVVVVSCYITFVAVKGYRYENPLTHRRPYLISVPETPLRLEQGIKHNNNTNNGEVNQECCYHT
jgi:hypothetical protein